MKTSVRATKTNITLKLDRELLRKARVLAAERDTSISALCAEQLEKAVRDRDSYQQAKRRALARLERGYNLGYKPPASREEFYER
jgi:predicted transcriptional regulator